MKKLILLFILFCTSLTVSAQEDVSIDGRLKPLLDDFFNLCKAYDIDYHDNLFKLKKIAIVDTLQTDPHGSTLGMLQRNNAGEVENIVVNWMATIDQEILRVVAFHEFGHYFLGYSKHVCDDCGVIMSKLNSSYFEIANDWENQLKILFENAPAYQKKKNEILNPMAYPQN